MSRYILTTRLNSSTQYLSVCDSDEMMVLRWMIKPISIVPPDALTVDSIDEANTLGRALKLGDVQLMEVGK